MQIVVLVVPADTTAQDTLLIINLFRGNPPEN